MTSIMRRTVRGAAAGMGALAIIAGTAACGGLVGGGEEGDGGTGAETEQEGGETEEGADDSTESEDTETTEESQDTETTGESEDTEGAEDAGEGAQDEAEDAGTDEGDTAEDGGDAAGAALSDEDLTAVGDLYYEFLQTLGANDGESACALITNPMTGEPMEGTMLSECAKGFEGEGESAGVDPALIESLDRSMIESVDNGDGSASATMMGTDVGFTFVKADDGTWYIDGSQFI